MALLPASSALDLATDHLAQVEALYLAIRKANVEADATGTPQQQARENVRLLSNLYIAAKKARLHPHARTVHEKSHAARMILESDWRSAIMRLSNDLFYKLDVEAAYNAAVRGWLPAPDDPPDGVLAGETPGFFKMRRIRKDVAARLSTVEPGDLAKVEAWGGARGSMGWLALNAKDASHVRILRDANGDPVAVAAVGVEGGDLRVRILGAKEGFGRRMMQELSKEATKQGLGMSLVSTHGSEGFYQKLGMSGDASGLYRFSPEQTSAFSKLGGTLPPPGAKASGLSPMENMAVQQMAWTAVAGAKEGELITSDTIRNALATSMDESVWARGAVQQYLGIAMQTASAAGQVSLEHLGLDKTWTWANPENMANDLFGVRGSKVVQNMYGDHLTTLQNIITDATDPRNPKTIAEVKAAIGEQWPGLQRYQVERIARTETGAVWMQTAANSYEANGIGSFESIVAQGPSIGVDSEDPCDDCVEAAAEVHDMNDDLPPWHPNCRCDIVPILDNPDGTPWLPPDEPWTGGAPPEDFTPMPAPAPPLTAPEPLTVDESLGQASEASLRSNVNAANFRIGQLQTKMGRLDGPELEQARARLAAEMKARDEYQAQLDALSSPPEIPAEPSPSEPPPAEEEILTNGPATKALDDAYHGWKPDAQGGHDQAFAINRWRTADGTQEIQSALRGDAAISAKDEETIKHLDEAIEGSPATPVPLDMSVFRGVNSKMFGPGGPKIGEIVHERGYTATTTEREVAEHYAQATAGEGGEKVIIQLEVPKGTKGIWMRTYGERRLPADQKWEDLTDQQKEIIRFDADEGNRELLLGRGHDFHVTEVTKTGDTTLVKAKLVPESAPVSTPGEAAAGFKSPTDVVNVRLRGADERAVVDHALTTMGDVIRMPDTAPTVDIIRGTGSSSFVGYKKVPTINGSYYEGAESTVVHEFAHYMDWVLGGADPEARYGKFLRSAVTRAQAERAPDIQKLIDAIVDTPEYRTLREATSAHYKYLRRGEELFARSFEQYIGVRTGDEAILQKIATTQRLEEQAQYWSAESFGPIEKAWDELLGGRGMLREAPPTPPAVLPEEPPLVPEAPPQIPPPPDDPSRRYWTVPDSTSEPFGITGNGLTNDELFAIDKYVGSGTLGSYQTVNQWLRKLLIKRGKNLEEIKSNIALLDSAIEKAPTLDHPMTLYRGVARTDFYGGVPTVGQVLEDPAFLSTSTTPALPTSWADVHGDIWTIEVPAGTKGINVNAALEGTVYGPRGMDYATAKEKEIILARGQKLVVDSVKERVTMYPNGGSVTAHDVTAHIEPADATPSPPSPPPPTPTEPPVSPPPAPPAAPPLFPSVPVKPLAIAPSSWDEQAFNSTLLPWKGQEVRITGQSADGTGTYVTQGTLGYYEKWPVIDNATLGSGGDVLKIEVKVDGEWKTIAEGSPTSPSATVVAPVKPVLESPRPAPNIDHRPPPNPEEKPLPEKVAEPEQTTIESGAEGLGTKEGADTALWRLYNDNPKVQFGDTQVRFTYTNGRTMRGKLWRARYNGEEQWVIGRKVIMRPDLITKIEFKPGSNYQVFEEAKTLSTGEKQTYRIYDEAPAPREHVPQFKSVAEAKKWLVDSRLVTMADLASLNDLKGLQAVCDGLGGVLRPYGVELDGVFMRNPGGSARATYNRGSDRFIHALPGEEARKQMFSGSFIRGTAKSMKWRDATNSANDTRLSFETSKERTLAQLEQRINDAGRPQELRDKAQVQYDAMQGCTRWTIAEETPNPIRATYAHEAAHALDASYGKLSTTFGRILKDKWGDDAAQMYKDRYGVSEYGATGGRDAWTELWAESYAARELGVAIPKNISDAIDETLATIKTDGLTIRLGPNRVVSASERPSTSELANATTYARESLGGASSVKTDALPLLEHPEPALDAAPAGTTIDVPRTTTSGPVWGTWVKESNGEWEQRSFGGVPLGSSRPSSFLDVGLSIAYTLAFPGPALGRGALADAAAWATFATQLKGYLSPPQSERTRRLRQRVGLPADSAAAG